MKILAIIMLLKNLIKNIPEKQKKLIIRGLATNSKKVKKGYIFFAVKGHSFNGENFIKEAAMAKLYVSEVAMKITREAIQIHGVYGYVHENDVERFFRDAKILEIVDGTSEIQRLTISREIIKDKMAR